MVPSKCNVAHVQLCAIKSRLKVGVASFSIMSLHHSNQRMKTHDRNRCRTPFLATFIVRSCTHANECDVTLGWYRNYYRLQYGVFKSSGSVMDVVNDGSTLSDSNASFSEQ